MRYAFPSLKFYRSLKVVAKLIFVCLVDTVYQSNAPLDLITLDLFVQ